MSSRPFLAWSYEGNEGKAAVLTARVPRVYRNRLLSIIKKKVCSIHGISCPLCFGAQKRQRFSGACFVTHWLPYDKVARGLAYYVKRVSIFYEVSKGIYQACIRLLCIGSRPFAPSASVSLSAWLNEKAAHNDGKDRVCRDPSTSYSSWENRNE